MDKGRALEQIGTGFGTMGFIVMAVPNKLSWGWAIAGSCTLIFVIFLVAAAFVRKNLKPLWVLGVGIVVGVLLTLYARHYINIDLPKR